mmetsp:Transcript_113561/g.321576  ORF Transcript_113561/g.321576 Transcript_113561/m.321576 type:complete len:261 (-) Transcript_113561:183-965(-)
MMAARRGGGRGAAGDGGSVLGDAPRGGGPARGRGFGRGSSLVVTRFNPATAFAADSSDAARKEGGDEAAAEGDGPLRKKSRKAGQESIEVKATFARVFKGGPRRKEADLPEGEDEGQEAVIEEPPAEEGGGGGLPWLSSLGAAPGSPAPSDDDRPAAPAASGELSWLTSLKTAGSRPPGGKAPAPTSGAAGASQDPAAATGHIGKPLDGVPPFWRVTDRGQLEHELKEKRGALLKRIRRLAKDAERREARFGHVKRKPRR